MYKAFLIDLDGTAYLGTEKIDSCITFVNNLVETNTDFMFLTNNSSATQQSVCDKLNNMGYKISTNNIYTSAMACATYIKSEYPNQTVYSMGDMGLNDALISEGITLVEDDADIVVCGLNREITYNKMAKGVVMINNGATFISTNPDRAIPTEQGMLPGNGALTKLVEYATAKEAIIIGKPSSIIVNYAVELLNYDKKDIALIGDNYDTDILCGINGGIDTIYVGTGLTTKEEVLTKEILPTHMFKNLDEYNL